MPFEFCNVDLDIRSTSPLSAITDHFATYGDRVFSLFSGEVEPGQYLASFEIHWDDSLYPVDEEGASTGPEQWGAEERIAAFCELIRELPDEARSQWSAASSRVFDLGYEADDYCPPLKVTLSGEALSMVLSVGAEIGFTVYPQCFGAAEPEAAEP
jgi:hypothetical protein